MDSDSNSIEFEVKLAMPNDLHWWNEKIGVDFFADLTVRLNQFLHEI